MTKRLSCIALVMLLALTAGSLNANDLANPVADAVDTEVKTLVDKVYPAFVLIGGGSGVCISPDGYFLTNHHVWPDAVREAEIVVRMAGRSRSITADAVGADPRGDIVLGKLRLNGDETVPYVNLADSDTVQVGDMCLCIGNPFLLAGTGSEPTVTLGTVTSTYRFQGGYNATIQIDTPINPGNSGGPAFNIRGEVIGINGRNIPSHGKRFNTGAGYAIPANQIRNFMAEFKAQEGGAHIVRHGLVGGITLDHSYMGGAKITEVAEGTEAQRRGFEGGDVIVAIDHYEVFNAFRYYGITGLKPRNSTFVFRVRRGEDELELTARIDIPVEAGQFTSIPRSDDDARRAPEAGPMQRMMPFAVPERRVNIGLSGIMNEDTEVGGLHVTNVPTGGGASRAGILVDDVVTHVNGRKISAWADIFDVLLVLVPGDAITLTLQREGETLDIEVITTARGR